MILKHIETFVCVYEECSMTRAAARLNIVQPAVSSQLRKLEAELKVTLFDRSPRGITPTAAGRRMYRLFVPVLEAFRAAEREAYALSAEDPVEIAVGFNPYTGSAILGAVLQAFRLRYPEIDVRITEEISPVLVERVASGALDLAVVNVGAEGNSYASTLFAVPLLEEDLVFVEGAIGNTVSSSPIALADVAARRLVLPKSRHGFRRDLEQAAAKMNLQLVPELEINAPGPLLELVASGGLATVVPEITARQAAKHLPLRIRPIQPNVKRLVEYIHRRDRPLSPPLAGLIELVTAALRP